MLKITDADNFRRTLVGLCLIAAPLVGLVGGLILPPTPADTGGTLAVISENSGSWLMANLLFILVFTLFVPALLGLMHLLRGRSVVLGYIGGGLALLGNLFHVAVVGFALVQIPAAESSGTRSTELVDQMFANTAFVVLLLMFLVPFCLGLIILMVTLWRARVVPLWVTVCVVAGVVVDFFVENLSPDLFFILLLVGFGWIGLKVLRMSDVEWSRASMESTKADTPAGHPASAS